MATRPRTNPEDDLEFGSGELTPEQGWALFDQQARRTLDMSAEEFLRNYAARQFNFDDPEYHSRLVHMYFLLPFVRGSHPR